MLLQGVIRGPDGLKYFSREGVARRIIDPKNTVFSAKRLIGLPFHSKEVQKAIGRLPYELREGNNEQAVSGYTASGASPARNRRGSAKGHGTGCIAWIRQAS